MAHGWIRHLEIRQRQDRLAEEFELLLEVCAGKTLTALTIHWMHYSAEASSYTQEINNLSGGDRPANWVSIDAAP